MQRANHPNENIIVFGLVIQFAILFLIIIIFLCHKYDFSKFLKLKLFEIPIN